MSLDIYFEEQQWVSVHDQNITHNLTRMATEAGIYLALWRPEESGIKTAGQLVPILEKGIEDMKARPEHYQSFNAENGWGDYENFVPWLEQLLIAAKEYPFARVRASV
jgi:hypothetical protein